MENENQKTFLKPNTTLDCDLFSRADLMFPTRTSKSKCKHEQKKGTPIYIYIYFLLYHKVDLAYQEFSTQTEKGKRVGKNIRKASTDYHLCL